MASNCSKCSIREIRNRFGTVFAKQVLEFTPGSWHGPVRSAYGLHAVYIHDRQDAQSPQFEQVQNRVKEDWMAGRREENSRRVYGDIRSRYQVLVEGLPYDSDLKGSQQDPVEQENG